MAKKVKINSFDVSELSQVDSIIELRKFKQSSGYVKDKKDIIAVAITQDEEINEIVFDDSYKGLKYLNISDNPNLKSIKITTSLRNLEHLDVSANSLDTLELSRASLPNLKYFDAQKNNLETVVFKPKSSVLKYLNLSKNPITDIGGLELLFDDSEKEFELYLSPTEGLSSYISIKEKENSYSIVRNYFISLKAKDEKIKLPVKVLLLGNHASGKSHLVQLLNEYKKNEEPIGSTHLLKHIKLVKSESSNIRVLSKEEESLADDEKVLAYIYDFGGQDLYHGIYRMFMGERCVYCFVWDYDKNIQEYTVENESVNDEPNEDKRREVINHPHKFWLEQINYIESNFFKLSEESTTQKRTILVQSHIDKGGRKFLNISNEDAGKYGVIESFGLNLNPDDDNVGKYKLSFNYFKELLLQTIEDNIKEEFESFNSLIDFFKAYHPSDGKEYILVEETPSESVKYVLKDSSINGELNDEQLKAYLKIGRNLLTDLQTAHESGYILFYPKIEAIKNKIWYNPSKIHEKFHELFKKELSDDGIIPFDEFHKLVSVDMKELYIAMKLLFSHNPDGTDNPKEFILPNYLPYFVKSPDYELMEYGMGKSILSFRFEHFIPFGLMSRLIIFFGKNPDKKRFWRNAIFFTLCLKFKILIKLDLLKNQLSFYLIQKENKEIKQNEITRFREYFFQVVLNSYYDKDFDDKASHIICGDKKDVGSKNIGFSFEKIPKDMFVSLDEKNYLSVYEINQKEYEGRLKKVSTLFDDDFASSEEQNGDSDKGFYRKRLEKTTKTVGKDLLLRDFQVFSSRVFGKTVRIAISYARDDKDGINELLSHLHPMVMSEKIEVFYDKNLIPGRKFTPAIRKEFENADIIISLVSPSWAKSEYVMKHELSIAIRRGEEEKKGDFLHIPALIKPTNYKEINYKLANSEIVSIKENQITKQESDNIYFELSTLVSTIVNNFNERPNQVRN